MMSLNDEIKYANKEFDEAKKTKGEAEEYRDALATMGKDIPMGQCRVRVLLRESQELRFVRGYWDGGFDDDKPDEVGLGWHLQFCESRPQATTKWRPLLEAYAKTSGKSSACAELAAFTNLVAMTDEIDQTCQKKMEC